MQQPPVSEIWNGLPMRCPPMMQQLVQIDVCDANATQHVHEALNTDTMGQPVNGGVKVGRVGGGLLSIGD